MDRATVNRIFRSHGAKLDGSDDVTGWYLFPSEGSTLLARERIPFATTYSGERGKEGFALTVYFDRMKDDEPVEWSEDMAATVKKLAKLADTCPNNTRITTMVDAIVTEFLPSPCGRAAMRLLVGELMKVL